METEITVQVFNDLKEIQQILQAQNYELKETYQMQDHYFSKYDLVTIKKMPYAELLKNSFLVRHIEDQKITSELCYKNKIINQNGDVIGEEKTIAFVTDDQKAITIFHQAGLTNWCTCNNKSFVYETQNHAIVLQLIEHLGIFIESEEQPDMAALSEIEKFNLLKTKMQKLGLKLGDDYSCKKPFMLLHKK